MNALTSAPVLRDDASSTRFGGIDCLRGLAALAVFFFHLSGTPNAAGGPLLDTWNAFWRHGHLGVPLFFVISGVCITRTWRRSTGAGLFARQRLRRIMPAYWGSLAAMVLLAVVVKLATGTNDVAKIPTTLHAIAATLTLTTSPATAVPAMNWVYWSLTFELAFYVVMTALLAVSRDRRDTALAVAHALLCIAACWPAVTRTPLLFFVELWPLFGAGAALALWRERRALALAMLGACALHAVVCVTQGRLLAYWATAVSGLAACAFALSAESLRWPRPGVRLGEMSYSVYLLHIPLGIVVCHRLLPSFGGSGAFEILRQIVIFLITVALVWPFYRWLEKPFVGTSPRTLPILPAHAATST